MMTGYSTGQGMASSATADATNSCRQSGILIIILEEISDLIMDQPQLRSIPPRKSDEKTSPTLKKMGVLKL